MPPTPRTHTDVKSTAKQPSAQRLPAETVFASELQRLREWDTHHCPPGWLLSPIAVEKFILGDSTLGLERKIVAQREVITRVIIGLATNRGAMLVGPPGTAKSWLSELLAAAISGQSTLTVQGGSVETARQILYRWDEQLLASKGVCREALVPGLIFQAMESGRLVRFEELARCSNHLQDTLLSALSERSLSIPELSGDESILYAKAGFNLIATSNSLDAGINNLSAALKRRLNFETLLPISNIDDEVDVVMRESRKLLLQSGVDVAPDAEVISALVTIFHELRTGSSLSGRSTDRLASTVMSTAEAVAVAHAMGVHAFYYRDSAMQAEDLVHFLIGAALKDNQSDRRRLQHYFETEISGKSGSVWEAVYRGAEQL